MKTKQPKEVSMRKAEKISLVFQVRKQRLRYLAYFP